MPGPSTSGFRFVLCKAKCTDLSPDRSREALVSDARTRDGAVSPAAGTPLVQRIRLVVVALFVVGLIVQFYLAGRGAFGASSYSAHRTFGDMLHLVTPVI